MAEPPLLHQREDSESLVVDLRVAQHLPVGAREKPPAPPVGHLYPCNGDGIAARLRCLPITGPFGSDRGTSPLTVLADVPDDARVMQQEPFGPLALINPVRTLDEAIAKANALPYGLAAYAFTRSAANADRIAADVEVGNLSINHFVASSAETPFGGVKESGYGREGGTEGLECYTVVKNVSHRMTS